MGILECHELRSVCAAREAVLRLLIADHQPLSKKRMVSICRVLQSISIHDIGLDCSFPAITMSLRSGLRPSNRLRTCTTSRKDFQSTSPEQGLAGGSGNAVWKEHIRQMSNTRSSWPGVCGLHVELSVTSHVVVVEADTHQQGCTSELQDQDQCKTRTNTRPPRTT